MRQISLRRLLLISLVTFTVLPTLVVIVLSFRQSYAAIDTLTQRMLDDAALRIQHETREHLNRPNAVMNALVEPHTTSDQARILFANPLEFERIAFALTRQLADVPYLYYGTSHGDFLGVQRQAKGIRVGVRSATDIGRSNFMATAPGDRSNTVSTETQAYEPRTRPWYVLAESRMERSYTDVYASASTKKLLVTLAQPILDKNGAVAAVVAADLSLDLLSDSLRRGRISENSVAYIVDDKGYLVATSSAEALYRLNVDLPQRLTPLDSSNGLIAQSFLTLASQLGYNGLVAAHRAGGMAIADYANKDMVSITQPVGQALNLKWTLVVASPRSDFSQAVTASLNQVLLIVSVLVALAGLLAWGLAGGLGRRLDRLGAAAKQLGRGEIPPDHHSSRILDVAVLSRAMHDSGVQLLASREEIEAKAQALTLANETLEQRVTERTAQLEASREEALAAARAKASFLATMSHEIRTPLNGVVGMTTLLADTPLDTEQRDYLHTMRVSSDQLLGVINDVLDFSKIESGKLELENEPLNLQATIEEACDIAAQRAREKGLELLADIDVDVPQWVLGDVTRLRQVLLNFINNAVKFTESGQIVVSAHLKPARHGLSPSDSAPRALELLEFRVEDTGIGIPLDRQSALFQSFTQVDASTTRKYGGTGLGLAICKRLATLMGGEVGVRSAPGEGSTFWFTAALEATAAPSHTPADDEFASLAGKRALLVDDTELNLRILDKQLKRWGMQTVMFERAPAGLDWLASNTCDVIITDMHMPDMDGLEFAQKVRQRMPNAHVVLLTSGAMPTGAEAKLFDARLLKPYRQSQLFNALSRVATLPQQSVSNMFAQTDTQSALSKLPKKNQRILVADDNAINLKVALAMLAKLGYDAATASNGREAADMVSQSLSRRPGTVPFAAVLMDANMPVMDGFEATQLILSTHQSAAPPLIALTASVLEEDRQRCMDAGMVGFLAKPMRIDELSETLARYALESSTAPELVAAYARIDSVKGINSLKESAPQAMLLDSSRLDRFKEFDDEQRTMTREIVALFIADAPQRVSDIQRALQLTASSELSKAVHALKGAAANVGAVALADACGSLEHACLQGLWPENAAASVEQIAQLTDQSLGALRQWEPGTGNGEVAHSLPGDRPHRAA